MHIRAVHCRVATGAPTPSLTQSCRVWRVADKDFARRALDLRMTLEAKIRIAFDQQLSIYRAVRIVTNRASLSERFVLKYKWAGLFAMTLSAVLIQARHGQAPGRSAASATWLKDVAAVRIVALNAIHVSLHDRMMLRQPKFGFGLQMTLETRSRVFSRVDNEFAPTATRFDVLASRAMARFATGLTGVFRVIDMHSRMRTGREYSGDIRVALGAGVITHIGRSRNVRRRNYRPSQSRTGNCEEHNQEQCAESRRHGRKSK
jgi:hypothetical protein